MASYVGYSENYFSQKFKSETGMEFQKYLLNIINHDPNIIYTKVLDKDGNEILTTVNKKATRVMEASTAYMLTDCLRTVVNNGTGYYAKFSTNIQIFSYLWYYNRFFRLCNI